MFVKKTKNLDRKNDGKAAQTPALWMKKPQHKPVRTRFSLKQRLNNLFYRDISDKHASSASNSLNPRARVSKKVMIPTFAAIIVGSIILVVGCGVYFNYKNSQFRINKLSYIDASVLSVEVKSYLDSRKFFAIDTYELSNSLKEKNPLIDEVYVNKSFVKGMILDVKEHQPDAVIHVSDVQDEFGVKKMLFTSDDKIIDYMDVSKEIPILNYNGKPELLPEASDFIRKSILTVDKLSENGIKGSYTFDNFGNFSILTIGNKIIRLDLKERYFALDDQIKVLQNALIINANSSEFDLRFNYLVVKQLK